MSSHAPSNNDVRTPAAGGFRSRPAPHPHVGRFELFGLVVLGLAVASADTEAYIDPGTGSYIFQVAAAGALAAMFTVKRYWHRIRDLLRFGRGASKGSSNG